MLIPNKFNGYSKDGRREYHVGGGGGGGGAQTQVVDLPEWAKPTAQKSLALTESTLFKKDAETGELTGFKPYQSYGQWAQKQGFDPTQVAGFQRLQNQAFEGAGNLQPSDALGAGMGIAGTAAARALGTGYRPMIAQNQYQGTEAYVPGQFQNRFSAPGMFQPGQFTAERVSGPELQQFQMGPAERVRADTFGGRQAAQYMSPYIEQALEPQLREARRSSEIQRNMDQAQAVQRGAFGGSRQAIVEAERQRNLGTQLGDIRARGLQSAYEQASQQFNQDAARRLQAQQLNQQAGLTTGQQNLAALLGVQQLGTQTGMQAQLANQQQAMEAQRLAEQSRQFGAGQGLTAAQLQAQYGLSADQATEASRQFAANQAAQQAAQRAQYGQAAQQLTEQSRQYGAGLGLQGLQTALQGAGQMGQLGAQQFGQQKDVIGLQSQLGAQQQQLEQAKINALMQEYQAQQKYPYQQLEFMSNILRGTPMGTTQTLYGAQPSMASQLFGAGTSLAGAYMMGGGKFAEGGLASAYAEGGSVTDDRKVESIVSKLSDAQLQQARQIAMARKDADQLQLIDRELAERAAMRAAQPAAGIDALPADNMDFADGGIVAFADGGDVERYNGQAGSMTGEVQRILRKAPYERTPEENAILVQAGQTVQSRTLGPDSGVASANTFLQNLGPSIRNYFTAGASRLSDEELAARPNAGGVMNERILRGLGVSPSAAPAYPQASYSNEGRRTPVSPAAAAPSAAPSAAPRADAGLGATPEAAAARKTAVPGAGAGAAAAPKLDLDPGKMFTDELTKLRAETRPEKQMLEDFNKAREDAAKADKAGEEAIIAKFSDALKGKRERLDTREADLSKTKDQYLGLALLQAGAAMMSTPGSLGTSIGKGIESGSKQYVAGMDKLNAAKDKLADARDRLDELQLNRDEMSARAILKAESKIRDTALAGQQDMIKYVMERDKVDRETAIKTVDQLMQLGLTQFKEASATQRAKIGADATVTAAGMRGAGGPAGEEKQTLNELKALQTSLQNQLKTEFNKDQRAAINARLAQVNDAIAKMAGLSTMGAAPGAPSPGGTMSGWGKASVVNP